MNKEDKEESIEIWKIITIDNFFLKEKVIRFPESSGFQIDFEESFEFLEERKIQKFLTKKDEFKLNSLIKLSEKRDEHKISFTRKVILLDSQLLELENYQEFVNNLRKNFDFEIQAFSSLEQTRQSFIGLQNILLDCSPEETRALFISIEAEKTLVTIGTLFNKEQTVVLRVGKKQIAKYISILSKENKIAQLPTFIKASLHKLVQEIKVIGRPQLVCFDEGSLNLLERIFYESTHAQAAQKSKRLDAASIYQFCNRLISSNFRPNNQSSSRHLTSQGSNLTLYNNSAHLVLIGFLLQLIEAKNCLLNYQARVVGYITGELEKARELKVTELHQTDWFNSAQELALRFAPEKISQASQNSILVCKLFTSSQGVLHNWDSLRKKYLWLSCFFLESIFQVFPKITKEIITESLEEVSETEAEIIYAIILLVELENFASRVEILRTLPLESRDFVSKASYLIEMARAFNTTGRSAVEDLKVESVDKGLQGNRKEEEMILRVFTRLDLSPELVQVGLLKSTLESQFKQKIKIELESV